MLRNNKLQYISLTILILSISLSTYSQEKETNNNKKAWIGINYGYGMNLGNKNYDHEVNFLKLQLYKPVYHDVFDIEILLQAEYNIGYHEMLNESFILPYVEDYIEKRELYMQRRRVNEYVLNFGILTRYYINDKLSIYGLISVGALISDAETERQAKGFAFSDNFFFGISYQCKNIRFDLRPGQRHVSNANFSSPNDGHNTSNIEMGISIQMK